jgi:hypothetical protein
MHAPAVAVRMRNPRRFGVAGWHVNAVAVRAFSSEVDAGSRLSMSLSEKWDHFSDRDMLRLIGATRILITRVIQPEWNTREENASKQKPRAPFRFRPLVKILCLLLPLRLRPDHLAPCDMCGYETNTTAGRVNWLRLPSARHSRSSSRANAPSKNSARS